MVSLVNSHTNATRIGWHLWEIDLRFTPGLPPGWNAIRVRSWSRQFVFAAFLCFYRQKLTNLQMMTFD